MKNIFILLTFISISCSPNREVLSTDFINDMASEDHRIAGVLYEDVYKNNLETLTYESYINYLKTNEAPSAKGLIEKILKAQKHYFKTKKYAFMITLFYADENEIICDNSGTAFIDSVYQFKSIEHIPDLKVFSDKIKF